MSPPPALGDLAWLYARTGRASEAEPLFARAIALPPNAHALVTQTEICEHYAECLRSLGKHSQSEHVLARARELRSRHANLNPELDY